jgi:lysozyme
MSIVGNDVSEFQGQIDWNTYSKNSNFVIIRATYGNGYLDKQFFRNRDEVRRVNLPHGFYHYCYPQYNSPIDEANWFLSQMNLQTGESLYLDFEENYSGDTVGWCKDFLDHVAQHLNGLKPMIYLNQSYMALDWSSVVNAGYGLWLASYAPDGIGNTGTWKFMAMQQTTSSQQVPGVIGNMDRDVFFGDSKAFLAYGFTPPAPTPPVIPTPTPPPVVVPPVTPQPPSVPPVTYPTPDYKPYMVRIKTAMAKGWFWIKLAAVNQIIKDSGV